MTIGIIGGGVAGVQCAHECARTFPKARIIVLERKPYIGGRLRTTWNSNKRSVRFERGAWRVHDTHTRTLELIRGLGMHVDVSNHSKNPDGSTKTERKSSTPSKTFRGMSNLGARALTIGLENEGLSIARYHELQTGYDGVHAAASGSRTYQTTSRSKPVFWVVREGMQSIPERIKECTESRFSDRVSFVLGTNVVDINKKSDGKYECKTRHKVRATRSSPEGRFRTKNYIFDVCIIATPPRFMKDWSIARMYLRSLMSSLGTLPLHHIYIDNKTSQPPNGTFDVTPNGIVVSGDSKSSSGSTGGYFQFFYSCGRTAQFWNNLALSYPRRFITTLRDLYSQWTRKTQSPGPSILDKDANIQRHYWPHAVHFWKPCFAFPKDTRVAVRKAVRPHPSHLPRLYCIGEAYSSVHGWMEGALQTVEVCMQYLKKDLASEPTHTPCIDTSAQDTLYIEHRCVDVSAWKHRHPGSKAIIERFIKVKTDITEVFESVGHSEDAWKVIFHLSDHEKEQKS